MQVRLLHKGLRIVIDVVELDTDGNLECTYTYKGGEYKSRARGIIQVANMIKIQVENVDNGPMGMLDSIKTK
jgi:hypothetical protein